jgi:hypothetical protein
MALDDRPDPRRKGERQAAQQRADQINAFAQELSELEKASVLTLAPDQRRQVGQFHAEVLASLAAQFDVDYTDRQRQMTLGMRAASLIGAVTLSAAVVLLFYRVWGLLATPVQLAVLGMMPLAMLAAVEVAARREPTRYVASVLALIAAASFALNLIGVGTIFNMGSTPGIFAAWAAFALALAYSRGFCLLLAGGILSAMFFVSATVAFAAGLNLQALMTRPEPLVLLGPVAIAMSYWKPAARFEGFARVWRFVGVAALLLPLLFLSTWTDVFSYGLLPARFLHGFYDTAGFALPILVAAYGIRRGWTDVVNAASGFLVVFVYAKCFDWWWDAMPQYLFFLLLGGLAIGTMIALAKLRRRLKEA